MDVRAQGAAKYPPALCRARCRGILKIKQGRHETVRTVATIASERRGRVPDLDECHEMAEAGIHVHSLNKLACQRHPKGEMSSALAWDDLTGMRLDAGMVIEARAKEVQYVKEKGVYTKITRK